MQNYKIYCDRRAKELVFEEKPASVSLSEVGEDSSEVYRSAPYRQYEWELSGFWEVTMLSRQVKSFLIKASI